MSAQPRLFTAKRPTHATATVARREQKQHHAAAQKAPRRKQETVQDAYGDLS